MFPGQGSQQPGMGSDILESFPYTKHIAESVDHCLGFFLSRRMADKYVR
jgi:malonyl CoA-acyl carrier protein transacylase